MTISHNLMTDYSCYKVINPEYLQQLHLKIITSFFFSKSIKRKQMANTHKLEWKKIRALYDFSLP